MKTILSVTLFLCVFLGHAQDRLFTYTYQSTVLNQGQKELEIWNTYKTGKSNFYSHLDNRSEFEIGLGKNIQTAFYLNLTSKTRTIEENSNKSLETGKEISFSNEWKWKIFDPVANPIGLALYAEYGIGSNEFEFEWKLILDKKINNFTVASNAIYEIEFKPGFNDNNLGWKKETKMDYNLAFAYSLSPKFHLTMENVYRNVFEEGQLLHNAIYSGFGVSHVQQNFWVNFTVLPQIKSFIGNTNNSINLDEFEKIQLRLIFSYVL